MYSFIKELNNYSVGIHQKQFKFTKSVYETKLNYLKYINHEKIDSLVNPTAFRGLNLNEELIEDAVDVADLYPVSLEEEKAQIKKRADNLLYLNQLNSEFESCRNICHISNTRQKNLQYFAIDKQACVTDCMNVRTEKSQLSKPHNDEKVFVWLA